MRHLHTLTRRGITCGALALLAFGLGPAVATAAPEVFTASGSFYDGSVLSGTVTIDTATGKVSSVDLIINQPNGKGKIVFNYVPPYGTTTYTKYTTRMAFYGGFAARTVELQLTLPVSTLVDYEGGKIESLFGGESMYEIWYPWYYSGLATGTLKSTETEPASD